MLLFAKKIDIHWFAVKTAIRDILSKCITFQEMLWSIFKALMALNVIWQIG